MRKCCQKEMIATKGMQNVKVKSDARLPLRSRCLMFPDLGNRCDKAIVVCADFTISIWIKIALNTHRQ